MSIYNALYALLQDFVFGGEIISGSIPDLVATLLSTCGVIFLVSIPFLIVWRLICMVCGGR